MSPFNFEHSGAGHIPPFPRFVFDIKEDKSKFQTILSDDIEDVEYVDVSDPQPEPKSNRTCGKSARYAEILAYADKKADELNEKKDPVLTLFFVTMILFGAEWSDDNPESKFKSSMDRSKAFYAEVDKRQKEIEAQDGQRRPEIHLLSLMTASLGMKWATENPPKYD